jgi:hypothetical protein
MSPEIVEMIDILKKIKTKQQADMFVEGCKKDGIQLEDIGYILGYMPTAEQDRLNKLLGTKHPVFDNAVLKNFEDPTLAGNFVSNLVLSASLLNQFWKE